MKQTLALSFPVARFDFIYMGPLLLDLVLYEEYKREGGGMSRIIGILHSSRIPLHRGIAMTTWLMCGSMFVFHKQIWYQPADNRGMGELADMGGIRT